MIKPIVIFRSISNNENYDYSDDGEWGVSIGGKNPEMDMFVGCQSEARATNLKYALISYYFAYNTLVKVLRKCIWQTEVSSEELFKLTHVSFD